MNPNYYVLVGTCILFIGKISIKPDIYCITVKAVIIYVINDCNIVFEF